MTEPGGEDPQPSEEVESRLDAALGSFKPRRPSADSSPVSESGRSGMTWSPVTEAETGSGTEARPRSSFQFDLGSALARLGGGSEPPSADEPPAPEIDETTEPLPVRARSTDGDPTPTSSTVERAGETDPLPTRGSSSRPAVDPLPTRDRTGSGAADPLPTRGRTGAPDADASPDLDRLPVRTPRSEPPKSRPIEPERPAAPDRPAARPQPPRSVFDSANPTPTLPATGAPVVPSQPPTQRAAMPPAPAPPSADGSPLPTLPSTLPSAPPPLIAPIESAPSTPQLNALRSAQLRANRNDRRGKLFGRSLLSLIVLGGLVAAALLFGRSYLFPTEWDPALTPLVDEIQSARDAEFDDTLPLVERSSSEYAPLVTAHVLGADWNTRLPEWRALGLASGDGAVADVQARISMLYPAFFDPESDTIVVSADRSVDAREPALRLALESALASQLGDGDEATIPPLGLTGLESMEGTARRAFDAAAAGLVASAPDALTDLSGVPLPVAYQLRATDSVGAALLDGVAAARPGDPLPASAARLDDGATPALGGLRQPGDQQVLEPVALGPDDWALIWGTRLSPSMASQMADSLTADSYSVVNRSGVTCFIAVFQTSTEATGASLLADLTAWASGAGAGTQAAASQLGPNRVQVEACDPGATATTAPSAGAVDLVIRRQLDRLVD
jgi:hypothetical protein